MLIKQHDYAIRSRNAAISMQKKCIVKGAASQNGKTYNAPDFITGRFGRPGVIRHAARAAPLPAQPPHGPFPAIRS